VYCGCIGRVRVRVLSDRVGDEREVAKRIERIKNARCIVNDQMDPLS